MKFATGMAGLATALVCMAGASGVAHAAASIPAPKVPAAKTCAAGSVIGIVPPYRYTFTTSVPGVVKDISGFRGRSLPGSLGKKCALFAPSASALKKAGMTVTGGSAIILNKDIKGVAEVTVYNGQVLVGTMKVTTR